MIDDPRAGRFQLGERHHLMHKPDTAGLLSPELFPGQRVTAHLAYTDGVGELRNDDRRGQAPTYLRYRENRIVGGDHHVAGGKNTGTASEAGALHQGHCRHRSKIESLHGLGSERERHGCFPPARKYARH